MFDFSPTGILLAFVSGLRVSLHPLSLAMLGAALALLVLAHRTTAPAARGVFLGLAAGLGAFGLLWQSAATDGALKMQAHQHAIAMEAERTRGDLAEAITRDLAEQATHDLADAQADALNKKGFDRALSQDPDRNRVCLSRSIARRLRDL